jgi:hypothetical protein
MLQFIELDRPLGLQFIYIYVFAIMIVACADAPAQSPLKLQATSEHIIRVEEQVCPPAPL